MSRIRNDSLSLLRMSNEWIKFSQRSRPKTIFAVPHLSAQIRNLPCVKRQDSLKIQKDEQGDSGVGKPNVQPRKGNYKLDPKGV